MRRTPGVGLSESALPACVANRSDWDPSRKSLGTEVPAELSRWAHTHTPSLPYTSSRQRGMEPFSYPRETAWNTGTSVPAGSAGLSKAETARGGCQAQRRAPAQLRPLASELTVLPAAGGSRATSAYRPPLAGGPRWRGYPAHLLTSENS